MKLKKIKLAEKQLLYRVQITLRKKLKKIKFKVKINFPYNKA